MSQRIGKHIYVVIPDDDLIRVDELIYDGLFVNRSQAIRELVHEALAVLSGRS